MAEKITRISGARKSGEWSNLNREKAEEETGKRGRTSGSTQARGKQTAEGQAGFLGPRMKHGLHTDTIVSLPHFIRGFPLNAAFADCSGAAKLLSSAHEQGTNKSPPRKTRAGIRGVPAAEDLLGISSRFMAIDDYEWRPITFQGVTFPTTLMGASILEPALDVRDREFIDWVWGLRTCCGRKRSAPAEFCSRMAQRSTDLMLEHRQRVLDGICERLGPHGFDAASTYRDWITAFQRIASLSASAESDCVWSAPSHPKDMKPADWQRLGDALERARAKFLATGELDVRDG